MVERPQHIARAARMSFDRRLVRRCFFHAGLRVVPAFDLPLPVSLRARAPGPVQHCPPHDARTVSCNRTTHTPSFTITNAYDRGQGYRLTHASASQRSCRCRYRYRYRSSRPCFVDECSSEVAEKRAPRRLIRSGRAGCCGGGFRRRYVRFEELSRGICRFCPRHGRWCDV
jgi:hypothetical protein